MAAQADVQRRQGDQMAKWWRYLESARRKVAIAVYHRDCLERELASPALAAAERPPIGDLEDCTGALQRADSTIGVRRPKARVFVGERWNVNVGRQHREVE